MKPFYVLLILLWFKTKLTVYQSIAVTGISILFWVIAKLEAVYDV
jgi:hypothetical protein